MKAKFINEAFEKKSKDVRKKELLYPEINKIKDIRTLRQALKEGVPFNAIPEEKLNDLFKKANVYEISDYIRILKEINSDIKFPQSVIDEHVKNADSLDSLFRLSKITNVSEEDINRVINNSPPKTWHILHMSGFPTIDSCTWIEMGVLSLKDLSKNADAYIAQFIEEQEVETVPEIADQLDLHFDNKYEDIDFMFFLKRIYKVADENVAWRKFLDKYFPKKEKLCMWKLNL